MRLFPLVTMANLGMTEIFTTVVSMVRTRSVPSKKTMKNNLTGVFNIIF